MATTARDILVAAYATNAANNPDSLAADATEMLAVINRDMRALFSRAAEVNPTYFGVQAVQPAVFVPPAITGSWPAPANAELILRIERGGGIEVVVVPFDDRAQDPSKPAVYFLGRRYYGAGNLGDPTFEDLVFFYARQPVDCATLDSTLDPDWPEGMNGVLIGLVALYLDIKDSRLENAAAVDSVRQAWMATWEEHLRHFNAAEVRVNAIGRVYPDPSSTMVPRA